jgi:hypothetical protein
MTPPQVGNLVDISTALAFIELGTPVFVAKRNPAYVKDSPAQLPTGERNPAAVEFFHPKGWQHTPASTETLRDYRPGDALCAVTGHTLDAVDIDTKHGASVATEVQRIKELGVTVVGVQITPSGGAHFFIPATGIHTAANPESGVDFRGGGQTGDGRGFVYLAPTPRPKYGGTGYTVAALPTAETLDLTSATLEDNTDAAATYLNAVGITPKTHTAPTGVVIGGEPVELIPAPLRELLDTAAPWQRTDRDTGEITSHKDRSERFYYLCAQIRRDGFSQGQAVTLLTPWCNGNGKYVGRVSEEVARTWNKLQQSEPLSEHLNTLESEQELEDEPSTWLPVDLEPFINGTHTALEPTIFERTDGQKLIYPGKIHSIYGESESGKSFVAQYLCAVEIMAGRKVLYIDFEDSPAELVKRLRLFGATNEHIRENFAYLHPWQSLNSIKHRQALAQVLETRWSFVVIDGFTVAMNLLAPAKGTPEAQVAEFMALLPRRITQKTNAAVLTVDHVVKSKDSRGRFALGSQEKLNQVTGAAYALEVSQAIYPGARGVLVLRVTKDRIGQVRTNSGQWRASDRTQEAARITIDSTDPEWTNVIIEPPAMGTTQFRPTYLMQVVSEYLESCPAPVSGNELRNNVKGKVEAKLAALNLLVTEGYVERVTGQRGANLHKLVKPYRESMEGMSEPLTP